MTRVLHPARSGTPVRTNRNKVVTTRGFEPNKRVSDTVGLGLVPALSLT